MKADLEYLSLEFAVKILSFSKDLKRDKEYIIADQIGRSGTSIGANIKEAHYAQSKADFISKMTIALKEANETEFWLELAERVNSNYLHKIQELKNDCNVLKMILIKSVRTAKNNAKEDK